MNNVVTFPAGHAPPTDDFLTAADAVRALSKIGQLLRTDLDIIDAAIKTMDRTMPALPEEDAQQIITTFGNRDAAFAIAAVSVLDKVRDAELEFARRPAVGA